MTAAPLPLPRVRAIEVAASRDRHAPRAPFTLPGQVWRLRLGEANDRRRPSIVVRVRVGDDDLQLGLPDALFRRLLTDLDPAIETTGLPADLAGLLLQAALLPALEAFEHRSGSVVEVMEALPAAWPADPDSLPFVLDEDGRSWQIELCASRKGQARLLELWPIQPRALPDLPLPVAVRLGTTPLPPKILRSLEAGDVVLFAVRRPRGGMLVVAEDRLAPVERSEVGWRLEGALRPARSPGDKEWTMDPEPEPAAASEPLADLDDIPIQLAFEVGRLELPLGEVRRLGAGAVLDTGREAAELVRITANGRLIGQGALVEIEGRVGVRIVRLFDHG